MTLYLDASIIVPLLVTESSTTAIIARLGNQNAPLCTGRLAVGETGSAIARRRRMGELTDADGLQALATFDEWLAMAITLIDHEPADFAAAAMLVRRPIPKLLTPDAIHLATCRRLGLKLVTNDQGLAVVADLLRVDRVLPE